MAGAHPVDSAVRRCAHTLRELRRMMLNVADGRHLMFDPGHLLPTKSAFRIKQVERVHGIVNHLIANAPVCQHLLLRIWLASLRWPVWQFQLRLNVRWPRYVVHVLNPRLVMFPGAKGSCVRLDVQMGVVQRVISDSPEWIEVIATGPEAIGASLNRLPQHREDGVILAL